VFSRPPRSFAISAGFGAPEPKACPPTPYRPTHALSRQDSLKDTKLLLATAAVRGGRPRDASCASRAAARAPPPAAPLQRAARAPRCAGACGTLTRPRACRRGA
jgi:hypothetical protein